MSTQKPVSFAHRLLHIVTFVAAGLLLVLLMTLYLLRTYNAITKTVSREAAAVAVEDDARRVLERANDAVSSVELVLSFLEGASVLIGLGFASATIYGLRSTQETRAELAAEVAKIEGIRATLEEQLAEMRAYDPDLARLRDLRKELADSQQSLTQTIDNVARVFQAEQEFRLKNYDSAYLMSTQVLEQEPENRLALYMAGWLEVQYLSGKLDTGISHLETAVRLEPQWPAARAAYGVGLRRKARASSGEERERLYWQAEGVIKEALSQSPRLMDFEGESFWGPVGGILRDLGQLDGAIHAYEKALDVTPNSSYPLGNLATLYLHRARTTGDPEHQAKALTAFSNTLQSAYAELTLNPNNYYLLMDVAQAAMILGHRDPNNFKEAHKTLARALATKVSQNSLETSRRGWQDLLANCPEAWTDVKLEVKKALDTIDNAIAERK